MNRISLIASLALLLAACNSGPEKAPASAAADTSAAKSDSPSAPASTSRGPYQYKSGIIKMESRSLPKMVATLYFDDYGARLATVTDMMDSVNGKPLTIRNINVVQGGESVLYDPVKKVGMKSRDVDGAMSFFPAFESMSDSERTAHDYHKVGLRTVLGKECTGFSFVRNGIPMTVWSWGGIPLRTEIAFGGGDSHVMEAVSVAADTTVDAALFMVPKDIVVKDNSGPLIQ
jgi:hypothetical protein